MNIAHRIAAALLLVCGLMQPQSQFTVICAGGTFPDPIYQNWIKSFETRIPGAPMMYRAVGSERAIQELKTRAVDFAASDYPPAGQVQDELGVCLIPTLVGAAVPVYNIPNLSVNLRFTPDVLADIYLGKITRWNDPRIAGLNRKASLPAQMITVVHRSDGSGTSYVWTEFLSQASSHWKNAIGASPMPSWPVGQGAQGNEGIATFVSRTPFSVGYVEFIYALRAHLEYGWVKNPAGAFVQATIDSITAAASTARPKDGGRISIVNAPGRDAYPVASFTWFLVPLKIESEEKRQRLSEFLDWALTKGQREVAALGYVPLPQAVAEQERTNLTKLWK